MTEENYAHMEAGAERLATGLQAVIDRHGAPWHVVRVGARVEFICAPGPLKNGTEAEAAHMPERSRPRCTPPFSTAARSSRRSTT